MGRKWNAYKLDYLSINVFFLFFTLVSKNFGQIQIIRYFLFLKKLTGCSGFASFKKFFLFFINFVTPIKFGCRFFKVIIILVFFHFLILIVVVFFFGSQLLLRPSLLLFPLFEETNLENSHENYVLRKGGWYPKMNRATLLQHLNKSAWVRSV